jgi:hypothetical protein
MGGGLEGLNAGVSRMFSGGTNQTGSANSTSSTSSSLSTSAKSSCMEGLKKNYLSAPLHSGDTTFKQEAQNVGLRVFSALIPVHLLGGSVRGAFKEALSTPAQLEKKKAFLESQIGQNNGEIKNLQGKLPTATQDAAKEKAASEDRKNNGYSFGSAGDLQAKTYNSTTKLNEINKHIEIIGDVNVKLQKQLDSINKRLNP